MSRIALIALAMLGLLENSLPCAAQTERYELGKRLRRVELEWEQADAHQRTRCTEPMQKAVQSFFGLQLAKAGRWLDEAYFAIRPGTAAGHFERWLISHRFEIKPVCISLADAQPASVQVKLLPFYASDENSEQPAIDFDSAEWKAAPAELTLFNNLGNFVQAEQFTIEQLLAGFDWKPSQLSDEGDYLVELTAKLGDERVRWPKMQLSRVSAIHMRLEKLDAWLKEKAQDPQRSDQSETIRLSVRQYAQTIRAQLDQRPLETDYPSARLLRLAEELVQAHEPAASVWQQAAHESVWMTLSHHRQSLPVRVHMPRRAAGDKALPVLIAFHGAGGSENMFFETYGAGRLIAQASARGWMVIAPRHPLLGMPLNYREMLQTLSLFFPIDQQNVYLVGHSMGGAEVARQMSLDLPAPQAAVVIGGGGTVKDIPQVKETPWFVAAGEFDFGRNGAKALANRLEQLGTQVKHREYPSTEHMMIVQAALNDVFEFLQNRN